MQQSNLTVFGIPILVIHSELNWNELINHAKPKRVIFLSHGFGSRKEDNIKELEMLANMGFIAIGMDNFAHGERKSDLREEHQINYCIERSAYDILRLMDFMQTISNAPLSFGMVGISLGGMITYMAVSLDSRIEMAVPILGRPDWSGGSAPHLRSADFRHCRLMSITAGQDTNVPPLTAREFHQTLNQMALSPDQFIYLEYPQSSHFMGEEDWYDAMHNVRNFLNSWNR